MPALIESKFEKCDTSDPKRCQAVDGRGQCVFKAVEGQIHCPRHKGLQDQKAEQKTQYRLTRYAARLKDFTNSPEIKSLREEIGILKIMIEEIMNQCHDAHDILLYSNRLADLISKVEKTVSTCHRLELASGQLLDRTSAIQFATSIVGIISEHITDPQVLEQISGKVLFALSKIQNAEMNAIEDSCHEARM